MRSPWVTTALGLHLHAVCPISCTQRSQPVSGLINHADDCACPYPSLQEGTVIKYPPKVSKRPAISPLQLYICHFMPLQGMLCLIGKPGLRGCSINRKGFAISRSVKKSLWPGLSEMTAETFPFLTSRWERSTTLFNGFKTNFASLWSLFFLIPAAEPHVLKPYVFLFIFFYFSRSLNPQDRKYIPFYNLSFSFWFIFFSRANSIEVSFLCFLFRNVPIFGEGIFLYT